jgi:hypothetical protein
MLCGGLSAPAQDVRVWTLRDGTIVEGAYADTKTAA